MECALGCGLMFRAFRSQQERLQERLLRGLELVAAHVKGMVVVGVFVMVLMVVEDGSSRDDGDVVDQERKMLRRWARFS